MSNRIGVFAPTDVVRLTLGSFAKETRAFSQRDVERFAEVSGDCNPLHLVEAYAKQHPIFDQQIVHGMLVGSMFSSLFARHIAGAVYINQELRFRKPVYLDEPVEAIITVTDIHPTKKFVSFDTVVQKQEENSNEPVDVISGKATILIPSLAVD